MSISVRSEGELSCPAKSAPFALIGILGVNLRLAPLSKWKPHVE